MKHLVNAVPPIINYPNHPPSPGGNYVLCRISDVLLLPIVLPTWKMMTVKHLLTYYPLMDGFFKWDDESSAI